MYIIIYIRLYVNVCLFTHTHTHTHVTLLHDVTLVGATCSSIDAFALPDKLSRVAAGKLAGRPSIFGGALALRTRGSRKSKEGVRV